MKLAGVEKVLSKVAVGKIVNDEGMSKSAKMKALFAGGLELKEIAAELGVRYNFVYNVLSNYVIVEGLDVQKNERAGKKDIIIFLHQQGKTNKEIAVELKTNYNYVHQVVAKYKKENVEVAE